MDTVIIQRRPANRQISYYCTVSFLEIIAHSFSNARSIRSLDNLSIIVASNCSWLEKVMTGSPLTSRGCA